MISIHAPRVGSDGKKYIGITSQSPISIHAPRVGSDVTVQFEKLGVNVFLSTLPAWGATLAAFSLIMRKHSISIHAPRVGSDDAVKNAVGDKLYISIHAPRVGSDPWWDATLRLAFYFYPRSPRGERLC